MGPLNARPKGERSLGQFPPGPGLIGFVGRPSPEKRKRLLKDSDGPKDTSLAGRVSKAAVSAQKMRESR